MYVKHNASIQYKLYKAVSGVVVLHWHWKHWDLLLLSNRKIHVIQNHKVMSGMVYKAMSGVALLHWKWKLCDLLLLVANRRIRVIWNLSVAKVPETLASSCAYGNTHTYKYYWMTLYKSQYIIRETECDLYSTLKSTQNGHNENLSTMPYHY